MIIDRNSLGRIAYEEFIRQMAGATSVKGPADSWAARGEANREHWRCIAEAVVKAALATQNEGDDSHGTRIDPAGRVEHG